MCFQSHAKIPRPTTLVAPSSNMHATSPTWHACNQPPTFLVCYIPSIFALISSEILMQERMEMKKRFSIWSLVFGTFILGTLHCLATGTAGLSQGLLATKESRRSVVYTEAGEITALDVSNGQKDFGSYHLEFLTLDTRSLLLPVLLHADMVFYVHTGRGTISWIDKNKVEVLQVGPGDMYRLEEGTTFYIQSSGDPNREKLTIHAIFNTCGDDENPIESLIGGAYSNIADLVRGFDMEVLQMSFGVSVEVIEEIKRVENPPLIIPFEVKNESENRNRDWKEGIFEAVLGMRTVGVLNGNNDKKAFNIFKRKPDVENSHGQSIALTQKDEKSLKGSSMGVFMVNLTKGSMIGPHWNPKATEIAIVIEGHGIVQVTCPSNTSGFGNGKFKTKRFYVKEGDVFIIPKFYPMAQMSFINSSFVFVGFSNNGKKNHPQILAGKRSVIQVMDREIMAASFNVTSETFGHLLTKQEDAVLLGCEGCAEEVKKKLEEEIESEEKEQERRRKEEEEEAKRREEEEEARRHEEEVRRRDQEEKRREEDAQRKEEEEEKKREEERKAKEAQRREEEEEAQRRKEEEEAQRREEEREMRKREEEEEAQRKWKEDDQRAREIREQEEEVRRRKREEEAQREWERRKEEEEACEEEKRKEKHRGDVMRKCKEEKDEAQRKEKEREEEDERERSGRGD